MPVLRCALLPGLGLLFWQVFLLDRVAQPPRLTQVNSQAPEKLLLDPGDTPDNRVLLQRAIADLGGQHAEVAAFIKGGFDFQISGITNPAQ